jgi:AraC family transcriptional regulator
MKIQCISGKTHAVVAKIERKTYSPHTSLATHAHDEARVLCVLAGSFTETLGSRTFECSRGTVLFRGPDEPHANDCGASGAECLAVGVSGRRLASDPLLGALFAAPTVYPVTLRGIAMRIDAELMRGDRATPLAVECLALELLAAAIRGAERLKTRAVPKCLRDAHSIFEAEFKSAVRVTDVAAAIGVHPVYLARGFRSHFGYSPSELVRQRRVDCAARALKETTRSLSEIALECGFASPSHFSTCFVGHFGITPSAYKRGAARTNREAHTPVAVRHNERS